MPISLQVHRERQVTRIKVLATDLDHDNIMDIRAHLLDLAGSPPGTQLVLDLGNVRYIASMALAVLVKMNQHVRAMGGSLVLEHVDPEIQLFWRRIYFHRILTIRDPIPEETELDVPVS